MQDPTNRKSYDLAYKFAALHAIEGTTWYKGMLGEARWKRYTEDEQAAFHRPRINSSRSYPMDGTRIAFLFCGGEAADIRDRPPRAPSPRREEKGRSMPDLSRLKPGLRGSADILVGEEHTAPRVGSGRVRVLATPVMINMMEAAALDAIENLLPPGHQSLGTHLDIGHYAATPVGMRLRATAEVTKIDGRNVEFRVEAFDDRERIGDGTHTRMVVNVDRFDQRIQRKLQNKP